MPQWFDLERLGELNANFHPISKNIGGDIVPPFMSALFCQCYDGFYWCCLLSYLCIRVNIYLQEKCDSLVQDNEDFLKIKRIYLELAFYIYSCSFVFLVLLLESVLTILGRPLLILFIAVISSFNIYLQEKCDCLVQDHGDFKGCGGHVPSSFIGRCLSLGTHLSKVGEQPHSHHWPCKGWFSFNLLFFIDP